MSDSVISDREAQLKQRREAFEKKAMEDAVQFYELDHRLTKKERETLETTYSKISKTSYIGSWATGISVGATPFLYHKYRTGSFKGGNMGAALILTIAIMGISTPFVANKAYGNQLIQLEQNSDSQRCLKVARLLPPDESMRWWMYYRLTKDHPEHIMKDPRSKQAEEQRAKTIYSGRDPLGLYSGPKAEMKKPPTPYPDFNETKDEKTNDHNYHNDSDNNDDNRFDTGFEDPFEAKTEAKQAYKSAWDRIRGENGIDTSSPNQDNSGWGRIRNQTSGIESKNPYVENIYKIEKSKEKNYQDESFDELSDFDKLLEKERNIGDEEENKRW
ncbi:hypothetical protein WICMUC_005260 [Wickerhamomyces mucosus]|uniref:Uncharacterized protein n=1 Tax=Wickerhamomyces mucosus TaxID=1378264 RepID=A0A9P8P9U4_9ASCO|nr:hypothetical protein WICMUC_005260 [Wickerhamomyces mucosus]